MNAEDVFVLLPDCLRSAEIDLMEKLERRSDFLTANCYSSGTWTLPAHATLYSAESAYDHVAVRRGDTLSGGKVQVPKVARKNGYTTVLVSENPTFGSGTGFQEGVDVMDEDVHLKKYPSTDSPANDISNISLEAALTLISGVLKSGSILRNGINAVYGTYEYIQSKPPTDYPHHGEQVLSHLSTHIENNERVFAMVNLLDTHNPHYTPPERGAGRLDVTVSAQESEALAAANQNIEYILGEPLPKDARDGFESRDTVQTRMHDIYQTQVAYVDDIISDWFERHEDRLEDALVVTVGDHGQMFGAEGMVGHHTSLHPHGISVPVFISFPDAWSTEKPDFQHPTSFTGLVQAIEKTLAGQIGDADRFLNVWTESDVVTCVDGPTWNIGELQDDYGADLVDELGVRKIGIIEEDTQTVHTCLWKSSQVTTETYKITPNGRERIDAAPAELSGPQRDWLTDGDDVQEVGEVSARLEALGYK